MPELASFTNSAFANFGLGVRDDTKANRAQCVMLQNEMFLALTRWLLSETGREDFLCPVSSHPSPYLRSYRAPRSSLRGLSVHSRPQASLQAPSVSPSMWADQSSSSHAPGSQPTVEIANEMTRIMVPRPGLPVERCNVHHLPRARAILLPGGARQHGATPVPADWRRTVFPYQDGGGGYWREVIWISYPSRPWSAPRRCVCWWWQTDDGRWHRAGDYLW